MCYIIKVENELSPAAIAAGLGTHFVGRNIEYYPSLPSTMDVAREAARNGAPEGTVVLTGEQTAGRGRLKRTWLTPEGGLAFSVILYPKMEQLPSLIMLTSLAVARSIEAVTGLMTQLKWPNDVLISNKKVCGILIENSINGASVEYANIGIGINVNLDPAQHPEIPPHATSLSAELGREVSRARILRELLREIERLYLQLRNGQSIFEAWRDKLVTLGKPVRATSDMTVEEGIAESVEHDGSLLIRRADGSLVRVVAGDVTLRE